MLRIFSVATITGTAAAAVVAAVDAVFTAAVVVVVVVVVVDVVVVVVVVVDVVASVCKQNDFCHSCHEQGPYKQSTNTVSLDNFSVATAGH